MRYEPVAQRRPRPEAEQLLGARGVERRRGCPFGIDVSQTISPSKPVTSAIVSASSRIEVSTPVPRLTGSAPVVALGRERQPFDAVVDVEELAAR